MSQLTGNRCFNCSIRLTHLRRRSISDLSETIIGAVVNFWNWPLEAQPDDNLCITCWDLVHQAYNIETQPASTHDLDLPSTSQQFGHRHICIVCGRSILRFRHRTILRQNADVREQRIVNVLADWIQSHQITQSDECCMPCWYRARRVVQLRERDQLTALEIPGHLAEHSDETHFSDSEDHSFQVTRSPERDSHHQNSPVMPHAESSGDNILLSPESDYIDSDHSIEIRSPIREPRHENIPIVIERASSITLPNIRRGTITSRNCLFRNCRNQERHRMPQKLRRKVLKDYNYYVPTEVRVCTYHLENNFFHELYTASASVNTFSATQIEEIIFLLTEEDSSILFEDINTYPDHLVKYFVGITKIIHQQILQQTPRLRAMHRGSFALTALLCKLRTGDSGDRLSCLFQVPRRTLESLMANARNILSADFVPLHLGFNHINRQVVASKNSLLADGLFGEPEQPADVKPAIVIADGTYLYTQKCSNYLFQKDTYYLHKYRNLVKPFLIVCCDGYILDVSGPFSATTNDASILQNISGTEEFQRFFHENDVFILDRGFRDCIDDLHNKGYLAHMPECLESNQRQLTTLQGNRSRCVTINRCVVEAVNGKFKRDFKLFRHEYFNRAATHLMTDFKIAAALLNCFCTKYADSPYAEEFLRIITEIIFLNNNLADLLQEQNLNMRGGLFRAVDADTFEFPRLSIQDLTLFSCGVYQTKQAKSYIGEHFRFHGIYLIEATQDIIPGFHMNLLQRLYIL